MAEKISLSELRGRGTSAEVQALDKQSMERILYHHRMAILRACEKSYDAETIACGGSGDAADDNWGISQVRDIILGWKDSGQ